MSSNGNDYVAEQTNLFGRICDILSQVIGHQHKWGEDSSASVIWIEALDLGDQTKLDNLLCDLISAIRSHERMVIGEDRINRDLHLKYIERVKRGLLSVESGTWKQFCATFDSATLDTLLALTEGSLGLWGEEDLPNEELANLQREVEGIINQVLESSLDDELKRVLVGGLEAVRQALLSYRIFGAQGIRDALNKNIAFLLQYREELKKAYQCQGGEVLPLWIELLKKLDVVLVNAPKIKQLVEPAARLLLGSGGS